MGVLKIRNAGNTDWIEVGGVGGISIQDADGDTKVQCEESADEDIIRFDTSGTERFSIADVLSTFTNVLSINAKGFIRSDIGADLLTIQEGLAGFQIYNNAANTKHFGITTDGEVTTPEQPRFWAFLNTSQSNIVVGGARDIQANDEIYDVGSNYNTGTYTFTAPVDGYYKFAWAFLLTDIDTDSPLIRVQVIASDHNIVLDYPTLYTADEDNVSLVGHACIHMDASDTAKMQIQISAGGGNITDIFGAAGPTTIYSFWTGELTG